MEYAYESLRRVCYGEEGATFVPVCAGPHGKDGCGRFVKADATARFSELFGWIREPIATCKKCGRVQMPFEGFI